MSKKVISKTRNNHKRLSFLRKLLGYIKAIGIGGLGGALTGAAAGAVNGLITGGPIGFVAGAGAGAAYGAGVGAVGSFCNTYRQNRKSKKNLKEKTKKQRENAEKQSEINIQKIKNNRVKQQQDLEQQRQENISEITANLVNAKNASLAKEKAAFEKNKQNLQEDITTKNKALLAKAKLKQDKLLAQLENTIDIESKSLSSIDIPNTIHLRMVIIDFIKTILNIGEIDLTTPKFAGLEEHRLRLKQLEDKIASVKEHLVNRQAQYLAKIEEKESLVAPISVEIKEKVYLVNVKKKKNRHRPGRFKTIWTEDYTVNGGTSISRTVGTQMLPKSDRVQFRVLRDEPIIKETVVCRPRWNCHSVHESKLEGRRKKIVKEQTIDTSKTKAIKKQIATLRDNYKTVTSKLNSQIDILTKQLAISTKAFDKKIDSLISQYNKQHANPDNPIKLSIIIKVLTIYLNTLIDKQDCQSNTNQVLKSAVLCLQNKEQPNIVLERCIDIIANSTVEFTDESVRTLSIIKKLLYSYHDNEKKDLQTKIDAENINIDQLIDSNNAQLMVMLKEAEQEYESKIEEIEQHHKEELTEYIEKINTGIDKQIYEVNTQSKESMKLVENATAEQIAEIDENYREGLRQIAREYVVTLGIKFSYNGNRSELKGIVGIGEFSVPIPSSFNLRNININNHHDLEYYMRRQFGVNKHADVNLLNTLEHNDITGFNSFNSAVEPDFMQCAFEYIKAELELQESNDEEVVDDTQEYFSLPSVFKSNCREYSSPLTRYGCALGRGVEMGRDAIINIITHPIETIKNSVLFTWDMLNIPADKILGVSSDDSIARNSIRLNNLKVFMNYVSKSDYLIKTQVLSEFASIIILGGGVGSVIKISFIATLIKTGMAIKTPHGVAIQSLTPHALKTRRALMNNGCELIRAGKIGKSNIVSHYYSLECFIHKNFANIHGIPRGNTNFDFMVIFKILPNTRLITRKSPSVGKTKGGALEVVVSPENVKVLSFISSPKMEIQVFNYGIFEYMFASLGLLNRLSHKVYSKGKKADKANKYIQETNDFNFEKQANLPINESSSYCIFSSSDSVWFSDKTKPKNHFSNKIFLSRTCP